jgi:phage baseplate assembly protein V
MDINDLSKLFFTGYVSKRNDDKGTVIVTRPDKGNVTTKELAVLQRGTHATKEYWMPAIDDQVLCIRLPNISGKGTGEGFVLGAIYSDVDKPKESNADVRSVRFPDGSYVKYEGGNIEIHATGNVTITGANIYLN